MGDLAVLLDVGLQLPWQGSSQAAQTIFKLKAFFSHLVDYHDGVNDDNDDKDDDDHDDARGGRGRAAK